MQDLREVVMDVIRLQATLAPGSPRDNAMSRRQLHRRARLTESGSAVHTTLLYFEYHQDGLHFVEEGEAREYLAMWQAKTWGDLRQTAPALYASAKEQFQWWNEGLDVDDALSMPGDRETFEISQVPGASDGDWPRFPPFSMLDWMPERVVRQFGTTVTSVLNGPMVRFACEHQSSIVDELEAAGYRCVRADALADTLYGSAATG
jgi:hypothetical protein